MESRTVNDFVEDLISDGRTESEVLIVTQNSRWKNRINEIKEGIVKLRRRMVKRKNGVQ